MYACGFEGIQYLCASRALVRAKAIISYTLVRTVYVYCGTGIPRTHCSRNVVALPGHANGSTASTTRTLSISIYSSRDPDGSLTYLFLNPFHPISSTVPTCRRV